jgi:capsular polysaccharide transport system permease protein
MNRHLFSKDARRQPVGRVQTSHPIEIGDHERSALPVNRELPRPTRYVAGRRRAKWSNRLLFLLMVVVPTILAAYYYAFLAAPIYVSEAQFIVRTPSSQGQGSGLEAFFQSAGIVSSAGDAQTVAAYISSRNALQDLEKSVQIRESYARPEGDFLMRFPNYFIPPTFEYLYQHYQNWVNVEVDTSTNISTLTVYAFRAEDAMRVANRLIVLSEQYVNSMNKRAFDDSVSLAQRDMDSYQDQVVKIQQQITDFRNNSLMIDPNASSAAALNRLASLQSSLVSTQMLLAQVEKGASQSPQLPFLRTQVKALQDQIALEENKSTGGENALAPKVASYDQLVLKQQFLQQMLQSSMTVLQSTKTNAQSQKIYIEHIEAASTQDVPWYPQRILGVFIVAITCLLAYGIGRMLISATWERLRD